MPTANQIVNQAIQLTGDDQPPVGGNPPSFDNSKGGQAAAQLYLPTVAEVARLFEWDFSRRQVALTQSGTPPEGYAYQYLYPTNGIQVWQIRPGTLADPNNPVPLNWVVGNATVNSVVTKVIWANVSGAIAVYNNNPGPEVWDPGFVEAVVRLLASKFAMSLAGRPETSDNLLQSFQSFVNAARGRQD